MSKYTIHITTQCICPPIPTREYDWMAYETDCEEAGVNGYGDTELAAINDLLSTYEVGAETLLRWKTAE